MILRLRFLTEGFDPGCLGADLLSPVASTNPRPFSHSAWDFHGIRLTLWSTYNEASGKPIVEREMVVSAQHWRSSGWVANRGLRWVPHWALQRNAIELGWAESGRPPTGTATIAVGKPPEATTSAVLHGG